VPDQQARVAMLEAGDAMVAAPVPLQDIPRLEDDPRLVVEGISTMDNLHMPLNLMREPFDDVRVRHALNYAIDKQALVDSVYFGYAKPLDDSPLAPPMWGYQPVGTYYNYDVDKANELMAEAGLADGFEMIIWIPDGRYVQDRRVGEAVAGYLSAINVDVELQTYEWATYVNKLLSGSSDPPPEYGAVMISFAVGTRDADRGLSPIFRCDQWVPNGFSLSFYCNEETDEALIAGRRATDTDERMAAYYDAQKLIMEDAPVIFLVAYQFVASHDAKVHDVIVDPNGGVIVKNAWIEQ
jgi:peptide/nickel transport system substrate-binding protein